MKVRLTIKLCPETRDEALKYAVTFEALQAHFNDLLARGVFPPGTTLHWLLETVRFE